MSPVYIKTRTAKDGKRFLVYYRRGGRTFREMYGGSFKTKKEATIRRDLIAGELAAGRDPQLVIAAIRTPPPPAPSLASRWEEFSGSRVDVGEKAQAQYRNARDRWLPILGVDRDPHSITVHDVVDGVAELGEDLAASTVAQYVSNLGMVLDYADVTPNPVRSPKVKLPRGDDVEVTPPTTKTWLAIRDHARRRSLLALRLIEADGLRVSECANLEWGDVDFVESQIRIRREGTKTAAGRRWLPVPDELLDEIAALKAPEDRRAAATVFELTSGRIRYDLEKACEQAGGGDYSPHDLRHRRISLWLRHGFDPVTVARWAGHARSSMSLDVYGHIVLDPREDEWRGFWLAAYGRGGAAPVRHEEVGNG